MDIKVSMGLWSGVCPDDVLMAGATKKKNPIGQNAQCVYSRGKGNSVCSTWGFFNTILKIIKRILL